MKPKNHSIITKEDLKSFLKKKGFLACEKNIKNQLLDALHEKDIFLGKREKRNYKTLSKYIFDLHDLSNKLKNGDSKEYNKMADGHYVKSRKNIEDKHRDELYDAIDLGGIHKKAFYLDENIKDKKLQKKVRDQWEEYKDNYAQKFKSGYDETKLKSRPDKHVFILTEEYTNKIESKFKKNLTKKQRIQLEIAFLITQNAFSMKMRRDGNTPYFKHIKGVLDNLLMLETVNFEQVLIALLHDNLEDINHHTYDMLEKLFDKKVAEGVLGLTEKKRYHRIGFLPFEQREKLQDLIDYYVQDLEKLESDDIEDFKKLLSDDYGEKKLGTQDFAKKMKKSSKHKYQGLQDKDQLPPAIESELKNGMKSEKNFYKKLPKNLKYDFEYKDIFTVCKAISEFRYLDKKLNDGMFQKTDELLPIKFSDRIHNLSTLWGKDENGKYDFAKPSKRVAKLLETEYHFLNHKDEGTIKQRISKFEINGDEIVKNKENIVPCFLNQGQEAKFFKKYDKGKFTHYDILQDQIKTIKQSDKSVKKTCDGENSLYQQAKKLYRKQNDVIKSIEKLRKIERDRGYDPKTMGEYLNNLLKNNYERLVATGKQLQAIYDKMDDLATN